jgi:restriction endonuclease Mrr
VIRQRRGPEGYENVFALVLEALRKHRAKRWENPVGRPTVQALAGSLEGFRARTLFDALADDLRLTPEERAEVLPSGKQFTYRP